MLVILQENVENLGSVGDVVKVSDGFARNYLLPRGLVAAASENNIAQIEHYKKALEKKRVAQLKDSGELAERLAQFSCTMARKVGENDKLFGSVTTLDISEALVKGGFKVERRQIQIDHPIRSLGVHPVTVKLPQGVNTTLKVWIVKEG